MGKYDVEFTVTRSYSSIHRIMELASRDDSRGLKDTDLAEKEACLKWLSDNCVVISKVSEFDALPDGTLLAAKYRELLKYNGALWTQTETMELERTASAVVVTHMPDAVPNLVDIISTSPGVPVDLAEVLERLEGTLPASAAVDVANLVSEVVELREKLAQAWKDKA